MGGGRSVGRIFSPSLSLSPRFVQLADLAGRPVGMLPNRCALGPCGGQHRAVEQLPSGWRPMEPCNVLHAASDFRQRRGIVFGDSLPNAKNPSPKRWSTVTLKMCAQNTKHTRRSKSGSRGGVDCWPKLAFIAPQAGRSGELQRSGSGTSEELLRWQVRVLSNEIGKQRHQIFTLDSQSDDNIYEESDTFKLGIKYL